MAVVEAVRIVAVLLAPVTPTLSQKIHQQLGLEWGAIQWEAGSAWGGGNMGKGHAVSSKPSPVFVRMEGDFITE